MKLLQVTTPDLSSPDLTAPADSIASRAQEEIASLRSLSFDDFLHKIAQDLVKFAIDLCLAILVFYIGKFIIKKIYGVVDAIMTRRHVDRSLTTFVLSLVKMVLYFILVVTVISLLGIETSSFIAIFASAGVAIGMALSGTLQNFAGGVLILLLKPYKIGDYIEAQGFAGTVTEIQIFNTIISTPDNKSIIIPNGGLSTGSINNWSREDFRRVDWTVGISYGDSVEDARKAILAMLESDPMIVKTTFFDHRQQQRELAIEEAQKAADEGENQDDKKIEEDSKPRGFLYRILHPMHKKVKRRLAADDQPLSPTRLADLEHIDRKPVVLVNELADSSVNLVVRAWTTSNNYWTVYFNYNERFYSELPNFGVNFPFPQLDVHVNPGDTTSS